MDILYYLERFPKLSESFILNQIYELANRGHEIAVFALQDPDEGIEHEEHERLDVTVRYADAVRYLDVHNLVSSEIMHPSVLKHTAFRAPPRRHVGGLLQSKQCIEFLRDIGLDIDLVHTHFANLDTFPARYVASYHDVPCVLTPHAVDLYSQPDRDHLEHIIGRSDHVTTISEYNKRYIQTEITDATPISIVHAGIRPEKFDPEPSTTETRILTVARFIEKKGLPYAIRAVAEVVDEFPDLEYHIVGSGPMEAELRERIAEHGLNETVEILGNVSDEELVAEYNSASCFLLPCIVAESGDRDGIPVALMEAMAMKTPPISTAVSGIPELIDHRQNGVVVEPKNVGELSEAIASMLSDPEKQRRFGEAGREKVSREFNIEHEATKLERICARLVEAA